MQDHYWDHREARWVRHVSPVAVPEPRDAAVAKDAEPVEAAPTA